MPIQNPIWQSFNAGELSDLLDGRTDQEKYFSGGKIVQNFIPTVQGPAIRRAGCRLVGASKADGIRSWLYPFRFSQIQAYTLEFSSGKLRFWTNRGQLLNVGVPYEITTPWTDADLLAADGCFALRFVQQYDVMWIVNVNGSYPAYKLSRLGATNWTLVPVTYKNGPFDDIDVSGTTTIQASATTGSITLTASTAIFTATDVGTLFYVEPKNVNIVIPWEVAKAVTVGLERRYQGNVYQCTVAGTTGASPPVHTEGTAPDGATGATWLYLHSNYGYGLITAIGGGGTTATLTVLGQIPTEMVTVPSIRWAKMAFRQTAGYPTAISMFQSRLVYGRNKDLFMSVVNSYDEFSAQDGPDQTAVNALHLPISADGIESIRWIQQAKALLIGSSAIELSVAEQTTQTAFGPGNAKAVPETDNGSALGPALRVGDSVLFIQTARQQIFEMKYDFTKDAYLTEDLNVLSPHILLPRVIQMAFQRTPDPLLWAVLQDGTLATMVYNRARGVVGWFRCPLAPGVTVESISVIPAPDASKDDLWLAVRFMGKRYVCYMEDYRLAKTNLDDAFYVDLGVTYSGVPATTITGLGHLEGATVSILANGSVHVDRVVVGGQVTLTRPAAKVQVGLGYASILKTMRIEVQTQEGTAQGRRKQIPEVTVRLIDTIGGKIGNNENDTFPIKYRRVGSLVGQRLELFTGDKTASIKSLTDKNGYVCVRQDQPLPMTVSAIMPHVAVHA